MLHYNTVVPLLRETLEDGSLGFHIAYFLMILNSLGFSFSFWILIK